MVNSKAGHGMHTNAPRGKKLCAKRGHHHLGNAKTVGQECIGATPMKIQICIDCYAEFPLRQTKNEKTGRLEYVERKR